VCAADTVLVSLRNKLNRLNRMFVDHRTVVRMVKLPLQSETVCQVHYMQCQTEKKTNDGVSSESEHGLRLFRLC